MKMELKELNLRNKHLEIELINLTALYEELIEKWRNGLLKIDKLQNENAAIIESYELKIKKLLESSATGELKLKEKIRKLTEQNTQFKHDVMK
jgi:hypothetical protein